MSPGPTEFVLAAPGSAAPADAWADLDMPAITAALKSTGVWAPADQQAGLQNLVKEAASDGHDLHVVVLDQSFGKFTVYRDIATTLQKDVGGTVLVFGPSGRGTASDEFSRVQLEDGTEESMSASNTLQAATATYHKAIEPNVNWTGVTLGLIAVVIIGAVVARWRMTRRAAAVPAPEPAVVGDGEAESDEEKAGE